MDDLNEARKFLIEIVNNPKEIGFLIEDRVGSDLLKIINEYSENVSQNADGFSAHQLISVSLTIGYLLKTHLYRKEIEKNMENK